MTSGEFPARPYSDHLKYSTSLENLILPTPMHTTQILSDDAMIKSFYGFFEQSRYPAQIENFIFLGYSVIFLSALAVIRYRRTHTWFWLLICGIFVLMSFGPELKIFGQPSQYIIMPGKLFYDAIPEWDAIRATARFVVMSNLALAMLASYTVYGLLKNKFSSFKQQLLLTGIIGFVILFEFSMIPFPSHAEPIPSIYEEIKNDESKFAVLPVPIGGTAVGSLMSDPRILYHQLHHEKPIYGGYESDQSHEMMESTQTYFLNMFHMKGSNNDIIKQDLAIHGLSLFDYFDIKYVTLHKELTSPNREARTTQLMSEILNENIPIYEDSKMVVYKIPKPNSLEPFLLLGSDWNHFKNCKGEIEKIYDCNARATTKNSEILIVNPTNSDMDITLNLVLSSVENKKTMTVSVNNEKLNAFDIPTIPTNIQIENLVLASGVNVVTLDTDEFTLFPGKTVISSRTGMPYDMAIFYGEIYFNYKLVIASCQ